MKRRKKKCSGCQNQIHTNDKYYSCEFTEDKCKNFYLHKKCADLPREINLPIHNHPLTLLASPPYYGSRCVCNICRRRGWKWLTYNCFLCKFDIDAICASTLLQQGGTNILEHEGHPHPLTLILRPCLFHCDACKTEDEKDLWYLCNTCQFMIHKSCASAPRSVTFVHNDCDNPLILTYCLPLQYRNFTQYCEICCHTVHLSHWVYYCVNCRYFSHLKCTASAISNTATLTSGESEIPDREEGYTESSQLMQFPLPNQQSADPTSVFIANNCTSAAYDDNNGKAETHHRFHDHTLSIHNDTVQITNNNEILCNGCVCPISVPFYSCSQCNFFLHRYCAELPEEIPCPQEPEHTMKVKKFNKYCYDFFECSFCLVNCSGFACECVSCNLCLDILCASSLIRSRIKHDSHRHPLVRSQLTNDDPKMKCNCCSYSTGGSNTFSCKACNFNLSLSCVKLPGSVKHEYDRHPIPLTWKPIKEHPSDFICEICEEDINPRYWLYHCHDCNQSFHTDCLSPVDWYSYLKFGEKVHIVKVHPHLLVFIRNSISEYASLCGLCGSDESGDPILECAPCDFKLCLPCAKKYQD